MKIYTFEPYLKRVSNTGDDPQYAVDIVLSNVVIFTYHFDYVIRHANWEDTLIEYAMNEFAEKLKQTISLTSSE